MVVIFSSVCGAIGTYYLQKQGLSVVIASCLMGLVGAGFAHIIKIPEIAIAVFAGSFVGMTSPSVGGYLLITMGGITCGLLYNLSANIFVGIGGRLGAMAFMATLLSIGMIKLGKNIHLYSLLTNRKVEQSDLKNDN